MKYTASMISSLFSVFVFLIAYLLSNLLFVAWLRRNTRLWRRACRMFVARQLRALTRSRVRSTVAVHFLALCFLALELSHPLQILWLVVLLLAYVFLVSALTLSLLAQTPYFKSLWTDPFFKLLILAAPIPLTFVARGYSATWLEEVLSVGADNVPMAHLAATALLIVLGAAFILLGVGFVFEIGIMLLAIASSNRRGSRRSGMPKATFGEVLSALFSPRRLAGSPADVEIKESARQFGLMLLFGFSFMGCLAGSHAALALAGSGLGRVTLSAVVFDFDAAPALRCSLDERERAQASGNEPRTKALMLSTSQEKALLVNRSAQLFEPVRLSTLGKAMDRKLDVGRTVSCFEPVAPASPSK